MTPLRLPLLLVLLASLAPGCGAREAGRPGLVVGHVDHERAVVGWHAPEAGRYTLELRPEQGPTVLASAEARPEDDLAVRFEAELFGGTRYALTVHDAELTVQARGALRTAPAPGFPTRVRLVLGSCASSTDHPIWERMAAQDPHALVLLGDTPYIDAVDLAAQRAAHRGFLAMPSLATAVTELPLWSTWDDHDYGRDNGDGTLAGKQAVRRAWRECRPQARYGHDDQGIYTRVRHGPVEVFLLDLRWFAGLQAHPDGGRSVLGARQRTWLEDALKASDAPFKLLCGGMVWRDKGGRSQDDWGSYPQERDALFAFLGRERIAGCVLLGGDVHACQHAVYEDTGAGYPLHELVVSPLHERAWRGGDRPHPARRWGAVVPHVFLRVDVDTTVGPGTLKATWMRADGKALHAVSLDAAALVPGAR